MTSELQCPCKSDCTTVVTFDCCGKSRWTCDTIRTHMDEGDTVVVCAESKGCNIVERQSQCAYCKEIANGPNLAFREYRGLGSRWAEQGCATCNYHAVAHGAINESTRRPGITDHVFTPRGPAEFDTHYCGCKGWD